MNVANAARAGTNANGDAAAEAIAREVAEGALALTGAAGTGKTHALVQRARRLGAREGTGAVWLTAPSDTGVARLRTRADAAAEQTPQQGATCIEIATFGDVALRVLSEARAADRVPSELTLIDDVTASLHFETAGAELFALEWTEFVSAEIDPEITGLRAPERFSAAAFRLIRKLRASLVSPEAFKTYGLQGATRFYAHVPNFADAELIVATAAKYRDSLRAGPAELERQHAREIDLVRILARLYESYVETLVRNGCLTATDAVYEATLRLRADPAARAVARTRFGAILVDDAQDATAAQLAFLDTLTDAKLAGVTLAGDAAQTTRAFATGARGADVFKLARETIVLDRGLRCAPTIERVALLGAKATAAEARPASTSDAVQLYRATSLRDEALFVASEAARLIADGTAPQRIAVITRNLACAHAFVDALLARNVPVDVGGAASLYGFPVVADALAALWAVVDPFRHDHMLRNLEAPWLRLCDASIAVLCGDPAEPQPLLFDLPGDEAADAPAGRWDRRRDLRLGRNVTRGDVDIDLPGDARERIVAFRHARERWERVARSGDVAALARLVLDETVLATLPSGTRGRYEALLIDRLLDDIDASSAHDPLGSLEDFLLRAERIAEAEADLLSLRLRDPHAVRLIDVETAKGEEYDAVFVVDVRAGAWPRYYTPDAFLFLPALGMIPKENVGGAAAARTAKFTYAMFRHKFRDKYNAEERRAFYVAATRARERLYVSASGRATRAVAAPEILAELQDREPRLRRDVLISF